MTGIAVYIEGGGDRAQGKSDLREGMSEFPRASRDGWDLRCIDERSIHLMAQVMETWILADIVRLADHYGQGFLQNAIPRAQDLETVSKDEVHKALRHATKGTGKGGQVPPLAALARENRRSFGAAKMQALRTPIRSARRLCRLGLNCMAPREAP